MADSPPGRVSGCASPVAVSRARAVELRRSNANRAAASKTTPASSLVRRIPVDRAPVYFARSAERRTCEPVSTPVTLSTCMGALDYRTRLVGQLRQVEPERFFAEELPRALRAHAPIV